MKQAKVQETDSAKWPLALNPEGILEWDFIEDRARYDLLLEEAKLSPHRIFADMPHNEGKICKGAAQAAASHEH